MCTIYKSQATGDFVGLPRVLVANIESLKLTQVVPRLHTCADLSCKVESRCCASPATLLDRQRVTSLTIRLALEQALPSNLVPLIGLLTENTELPTQRSLGQ